MRRKREVTYPQEVIDCLVERHAESFTLDTEDIRAFLTLMVTETISERMFNLESLSDSHASNVFNFHRGEAPMKIGPTYYSYHDIMDFIMSSDEE